MAKKVLVIQTAFIGDVILATVIIENIAKEFPGTKIDFVLRKGNESLLNNNPFVNKIISWDKSSRKYKYWFGVVKEIRKEEYDIVVNVQRFFSTGLLTILSKAKLKVGFNKNPLSFFFSKKVSHLLGNKERPIHEVDRNLLLINRIVHNPEKTIKLYPSQQDWDEVKQYKTEAYICIAPASVWFTKQFPKEKWIELIEQIASSLSIYLLGGPDDIQLCNDIIRQFPQKKVMSLAGKLSLLQSAALMKNAQMNYVNDSSPLHIASAMNAPTTAIFCSTVPDFGFGPLADQSKIIQTKQKLNCRPCGLHGFRKCPKNHFLCALSIDVKDIVQDASK